VNEALYSDSDSISFDMPLRYSCYSSIYPVKFIILNYSQFELFLIVSIDISLLLPNISLITTTELNVTQENILNLTQIYFIIY